MIQVTVSRPDDGPWCKEYQEKKAMQVLYGAAELKMVTVAVYWLLLASCASQSCLPAGAPVFLHVNE